MLYHRLTTSLVFVPSLWFAGPMRVAAIGDAHLGRSYYPFTTDSGINQREFDFEQSFEAAVELALAQHPDLVIWLGDVFDHPRPTYRSFRVAQRALARIRDSRRARGRHQRQPRHPPAARARAAPTRPWRTASPRSTSPTAWPTSASSCPAWWSTPCRRC